MNAASITRAVRIVRVVDDGRKHHAHHGKRRRSHEDEGHATAQTTVAVVRERAKERWRREYDVVAPRSCPEKVSSRWNVFVSTERESRCAVHPPERADEKNAKPISDGPSTLSFTGNLPNACINAHL